jgi:hypothetical protein
VATYFPGTNGYPTLECWSPEFLQCLKLLTRRTVLPALQTRGFVTLKVRIVAVEEEAFQSVGLEHDRIGYSFSPYLKACRSIL